MYAKLLKNLPFEPLARLIPDLGGQAKVYRCGLSSVVMSLMYAFDSTSAAFASVARTAGR
jgi:hypothetical protein